LQDQSNRVHTGITARVYVDFAPEGTNHVFAYAINFSNRDALDRRGYSSDKFTTAVLGFDDVLSEATKPATLATAGNVVVTLTSPFSEDNILNGLPFSTWISRLTSEQSAFFDAEFDGPLRVRGPAGSGKTLVLTLAFLKHVYHSIDNNNPINYLFLAHGEETADNIRKYLMLADERDVFTHPPSGVEIEVTPLTSVANNLIRYDIDDLEPLSLDGAEGRKYGV
jgi:hypothetical protein